MRKYLTGIMMASDTATTWMSSNKNANAVELAGGVAV
jgi:hypothetical protein